MPTDAATPKPPPPPERSDRDPRVARSRARLIQAATHLLADGGIHAVTIDAVTSASGVSRATLYRHFTTGAELVAAAFEQLIPPVSPPPESGSLRHRLLTLLTEQAQLIQNAPLHVTLLSWLGMGAPPAPGSDEDSHPQLQHLRRRIIEHYRKPFDDILADAAARHEIINVDTSIAIAQLTGPLIFNRLITHEPIDRSFCARIVDDFLATRTQRK